MSEPTDWQRLHWSSPLFHLFGFLRAFVVTFIAVYFASSGDRKELLIGIALILAAGVQFYQYFVTRYRLTDDELVIRTGLIFRSVRSIPVDTINNIDIVRHPLARWLGVAEAKIQTASGGEAEATLKVLAVDRVERLRARIAAAEPVEDENAETPPPLHTFDIREAIKLGLINNRGLVVFAAGFGAAWQFDLFDRIDTDAIFDRLSHLAGPMSVAATVALGLVLFAVFSVTLSVLRFGGFELRRVGDDFRITCGLVTQRSATIPKRRVQLVSIRSTPLHRRFKRVGVRVETAGGTQDEHTVFGRSWFVPIGTPAQGDRVLEELGFPSPDSIDWQRPADGAVFRAIKGTLIVWLPISAAVGFGGAMSDVPALVLLGPLLLALMILLTIADVRRMRWCVTDELTGFRSGVFFRKTSLARASAAQVSTVTETPFDRRRGMATLRIDTAGAGPAGHLLTMPYLRRTDADLHARGVASRAGRLRVECAQRSAT